MKIECFTELFEKAILTDDTFISDFIKGHLMLEFLMLKCVAIILPNKIKYAERLTHKKLIDFIYNKKIISIEMKNALTAINQMRNKLAHKITYRPTFDEYKNLLVLAEKASPDMTDGIWQSLDEIKDKTKLSECDNFIYIELFVQLSYDLHGIYQDNGGDIEDFQ